MSDATRALEQMDAARLDTLAARLQELLASPARVVTTPEIAARHRVFVSVLRATSDNLNILKRVASTAGEEAQWAL